ncbi:MAG: glycosyl transferase family 1 [Ferruginibacter sp.]|nr:glycosyl transferase family 1 [Ferruginibacter sp.]
MKKKILFLGETYRADAITWMNGLKEFGLFEIHTWELTKGGTGLDKIKRAIETVSRLKELRREILRLQPDLIIAERVTSYGFIGSLFHKYSPVIIAQQGITDIFPPDSFTAILKERMQSYAFKYASLIHAWGEIMTYSMLRKGADPNKIMVLAKGIDLRNFMYSPDLKDGKIRAVVTRSLTEDYRHETLLGAFEIIKQQEIPFKLTVIGGGHLKEQLIQSAIDKNIHDEVDFVGRIPNADLPKYLSDSDLYLSMPCTEGVSSSLFEAMSSGCYPIVTDLPGNRAWITDAMNGRLIKVDDVHDLATAIRWYAVNRGGLGHILKKNREIVEQKVSYEKNMKVICSKYIEIIKNFNSCVV